MDAPCSICKEMINIIATHERYVEFEGGIACMDCADKAKKRILKRELEKMIKEKGSSCPCCEEK